MLQPVSARSFPVKDGHHTYGTSHLGELVREYRLMRGWTIQDLAERTSFTPSYIRMIERGVRRPQSLSTWRRLTDVLRIPRSLLASFGKGGGGDEPPAPGGTRPADEEELLIAAWALFYRSGVADAAPMIFSAIQRVSRVLEQHPGDVAWMRLLSRYQQLAGVLLRDQADLAGSLHRATVGEGLAREIDDAPVLAAALMRKGRTLAALGQHGAAVLAAREAAMLAPRCGVPLRGYLAQNLADMMSREGSAPLFVIEQRLDAAQQVLGLRDSNVPDGSFSTLSVSGIAHDWALVFIRSGAPLQDCLARISEARGSLALTDVRWQVAMTCTEVLAYAKHGEVDSAVAIAEQILPEARRSKSHLNRLRQAYALLVQHDPADPAVSRLGDMLRA